VKNEHARQSLWAGVFRWVLAPLSQDRAHLSHTDYGSLILAMQVAKSREMDGPPAGLEPASSDVLIL